MLVRDLGLMAEAVYYKNGTVDVAPVIDRRIAATAWDAFQAAAFGIGSRIVVAFRGTHKEPTTGKYQGGDLAADAALGLGMNSSYFAQAEEWVAKLKERPNLRGCDITVCGHSLGGAIAQVVANRTGLPVVTFNAPGVAALASRNIGTALPGPTMVRVGGMIASAVIRPGQALRDVQSAFRPVRGLNVCLQYDVVSMIGVHYGDVIRIRQETPMGPGEAHEMKTMNKMLKVHEVGLRSALL